MAIPKKGSRLIVVDGVEYRWRIRHRPTCWQWEDGDSFSFAVEHAQTPASVLVVELPAKHPGTRRGETFSVRPSDVALHIEHALSRGWTPTQRGKPFLLELQNTPKPVTLGS